MDGESVSVGGMWPSQRQWWDLPNKVCLFVGGYGCLRGDTLIEGVPVAERSASSVRTLSGWASASQGYLKGQAELYRVTTRRGQTAVATLDHRFLTPLGWRPLSQLAVGAAIGGSAYAHDLRDSRTGSGWTARCFGGSHQHDAQLILAAAGHCSTWLSSVPNTSVLGRASYRHARIDSSPEELLQHPVVIEALRSRKEHAEPSLRTRLEVPLSHGTSALLGTGAQLSASESRSWCGDFERTRAHGPYKEVSSYTPTVGVWDEIVNIEFDRFGDFYDLTVPSLQHYEAGGLWHHNSGKSFVLGKKHIALALAHPGAPTAIVSPTYTMSKEIIVPTLVDLLEGQKKLRARIGQRFEYVMRKSPPVSFNIRFQYRNDKSHKRVTRVGRIVLYSGEKPDRLKGPNLGSAGIDEPFIQDEEVFRQMTYRVRHKKAPKQFRKINLTGTPEQLNWGYELAEGDMREQFDVGIVQASSLENLATGADYHQILLEGMDPDLQKAMIHGQFVNMAKGRVFYGFDRKKNVIALKKPPGAILGVGMDFNVNPMSACVFWVRTGHDPHIHFFHEIELPNSSTMEMCKFLIRNYHTKGLVDVFPDAAGRVRTTAGPVGQSDFKIIQDCGFKIHAKPDGNPGRRDRFNATNLMLSGVNGTPRMTIDPKCKALIKYMTLYSHDQLNTKEQKAMSHLLDATTYPVAYLFPWHRQTFSTAPLRGF